MAKTSGQGYSLFEAPVAFLFTDGVALPSGPAGWGVRITYSDRADALGAGSYNCGEPQPGGCLCINQLHWRTGRNVSRPRLDQHQRDFSLNHCLLQMQKYD